MKVGDLVRFKPPYYIDVVDGVYSRDRDNPGWKKNTLGLLVRYEPWEKMTTIMYQGQLLRIAARDVEKFGKKGL